MGTPFYGYRWYDPLTGRWSSRDPIEERDGVNLYAIIRNASISNIDVLGLAPSLDVKLTNDPGFRCEGNYLWTAYNYILNGLEASKSYYLVAHSTSDVSSQGCDCVDKGEWYYEDMDYGNQGYDADFIYVVSGKDANVIYGPLINQGTEKNGNGFDGGDPTKSSAPFDNGFDYVANHSTGGYLQNGEALKGITPVANGEAIMDIHLNCCRESKDYGGDYNTSPNIDNGENRSGQAYEVPNTTYMQSNPRWHKEWPKQFS